MNFTVIDWIFGILVLIFACTGLVKGFVDCIFNKLCWILGLILACFFYDYPAKTFFAQMPNEILSNVLGFVIVFVVVFLVVKIIQMIVAKIFEFHLLKSLDKVMGFAFGIIEGLAIVAVVIIILTKQPFFDSTKLLQDSFFDSLIEKIFSVSKEIGTNV